MSSEGGSDGAGLASVTTKVGISVGATSERASDGDSTRDSAGVPSAGAASVVVDVAGRVGVWKPGMVAEVEVVAAGGTASVAAGAVAVVSAGLGSAGASTGAGAANGGGAAPGVVEVAADELDVVATAGGACAGGCSS